jgi:hypothetical protein
MIKNVAFYTGRVKQTVGNSKIIHEKFFMRSYPLDGGKPMPSN